MDSLLLPIIADIALQDLELKALNSLKFHIPFYFRYVDDIILSIPIDKINIVCDTFNSICNRLRFTYELQDNDKISFQDLSITVENGTIVCDLCHKPLFSGRYLNYLSQNLRWHYLYIGR